MADKLHIALLGFTQGVSRYHLPYLEDEKRFDLKYICAPQKEISEEFRQEYKDVCFTEDEGIIENDEEINLVVILRDPETHRDTALKYLSLGKNVFIEKPVAMNRKEAEEIFSYAREKNLLADVNQIRRYDGDYLTLKEILDRNVLGEIYDLESHYDYYIPGKYAPKPLFLLRLGVHSIDQMVHLYGRPDRIVYDVRSFHSKGNSDDYFDIDLFYGNTKVSIKTSYYVKLPYPRYIVHGSKGSLIIPQRGHNSQGGAVDGSYTKLSYVDENGVDHNEEFLLKKNEYATLYQNLYEEIFKGKEKEIREEEVLETLRIIEGGIAAAKTNK